MTRQRLLYLAACVALAASGMAFLVFVLWAFNQLKEMLG